MEPGRQSWGSRETSLFPYIDGFVASSSPGVQAIEGAEPCPDYRVPRSFPKPLGLPCKNSVLEENKS